MNIQVNTQDLHVAIVPTVAVEFTTIIDCGDTESSTSPSCDGQNTSEAEDAEERSPMDNEEFAYPTNLTSEVLDYEDEGGEQAASRSISDQRTSTAASLSKMFSWDDVDDSMARGHFRVNNPSTGSDLIQVTVEDLLISEEQDRTLKANMDQCRHGQEHHPPTTTPALSVPSHATKNSVTTTTITATIRSNGQNKKIISFDNMDQTPDTTEEAPKKHSPTSVPGQQKHAESRGLQPPAPRILTPAQQREADADSNIQKAIELHENNQLEEATHHFWLAAQSENPLGQLMYGLSLRHGWGCKPNPTEALLFLQRAAEYAMGELNELGPVQPTTAPSTATTTAPSSVNRTQQPEQQQQQGSHPKSSSNPTQQTLRRMGSMDRTAAMITARKELVMALYELGMSYLKGWGVTKDKSVAFTYFKIAADLGDPDSQNETALCYYEGIGTDKDMYQSAKYYRMAAAQGASQLGNSWIWKPKYDMYCAAENAAALAVGAGSTTGKKKSQDFRSKFASAINTAMFQGAGAGATALLSPTSSSSSSSSSPPSSSSSKKNPKNKSSAPTSPSIPSPNYSVSTIASGLASVTAATSTGTHSLASSIKRPPAILSSMPTTSTASAASSVDELRSPTSSMSSRSLRASTEFSPTSPSPLAVSSTPTSSVAEGKQGTGATGTVEKKKTRWSLWGGGTHRSTITPSPATALQS
ncbi:hypothetical protein BGZ70_008454 [Mortierella alpina]|uniref:HCP-like protein n=1 Tax=Mortierella alpina TaxID=64518 RepID=A0A9P6J3F7_MORAP|nr:hypothetical protein BGZ70_008454 [Mortierella alpina]